MSTKNIALAYNIDNVALAESIEQELSGYTGQFEHFYGSKEKSLVEQLQFFNGPIILLVTDNFLKSPQCMAQGLQFLQNKRNLLLPVVADGTSRDEQNGELTAISTRFDRVSDIIQYINYWQDQYLDLRRQKRQLHDLDESAFNAHLSSMRDISSDVGEYLRSLRGIDHLEYPAFKANDYEAFFNFTQDRSGWERFHRERAVVAPVQETPGFEPAAAKTEPTLPVEPELDADHLTVDLGSIPGISQLDLSDAQDLQKDEDVPEQETPAEQAPEEPEVLDVSDPEPVVAEMPPAEEAVAEEAGETASVEPEEEEEEATLSDAELIQLFQESWSRAEAGQAEEGLGILAGALDLHPSQGLLRFHYAQMLAQKGNNIDGAKEQLDILLQADPENEDANFLAAEIAEGEAAYATARTYYEKVAAANSDYPEVYDRLGNLLLQHFSDDPAAAARAFKKAYKADHTNAEAAYQYALLQAEALSDPEKAARYFKKTLAIQPEHPFAWYDLALLYYGQDKKKEAHEAYLNAAANNPELKTEQNDQAFFYQKPEDSERHGSFEKDALEALKANIAHLEALLVEREQQELEAQEAAHIVEEPVELPPAMPEKVGKTVLISGATSGIGKATALIFAENGYRLVLTGRRVERLREVQESLKEAYDADVEILAFDVRDAGATKAAIESLQAPWNDIDILINNAGKAKGLSSIHEGQLEHWDEMIDTNIKGLLHLTRMVSPSMVTRGSGHIINVGSNAGNEMYPNGNVYSATKAAVYALTKGIRYDLYTHNIRVSQVSPAHVEETEFALVRFDGDEDRSKIYEDFKPLNATDVADAIFYMASRPAHVNVQDMVIMGTQQASSTMINRSGRQLWD